MRARTLDVVVLAVLTALSWWVWTAWDTVPYSAWQVAGVVVTLVAVAAWAQDRLPTWIVLVVVPVVFTAVWSLTAATSDESGLWAVGALLVLLGTLVGTAVVTVVTRVARSAAARTRAGSELDE